MIIDLRTISQEPRRFDFHLEPEWWAADEGSEPILGLDGPLEVHLKIYRAGSKYVLEGNLSGGLLIICDRCLESYHYELESEFRLFLALPAADVDQNEMELAEEDLSTDFITVDEIDPEDIIREQIFLSLPMKSLCSDDCAGLCPVCGADLNKTACACRRESGHPGFAKLKGFKLKGSED